MKVTTEKLPKSLMALDIELNRDQVERGLDRAARRLSQKYTIPGFRKGKAPRFIIENYFGRQALLEEASEDLINKAFKEALEQTQITPVGQPTLQGIESAEPFRFRVMVPVPPTVTLPDYRAIRLPLEIEPVSDETVEYALSSVRDKHVVLRELEEPRPAQAGDQLTVKLESFVDGEPLEQRSEGQEIEDSTLVLESGRLVEELYNGLIGANVGDALEITAKMPEDHANEKVRGKEVTFKVQVGAIQERLLPEWDELPVLENFEGTLDEFRAKTRRELEDSARNVAERKVLDTYIDTLVEQSEYDIPDVLIREQADRLLHDQEREFSRYGITLEQMLQYRGKTHDEAVDELLPEAERQMKVTLALQDIVRQEQFDISDEEIDAEIQRVVQDYSEEERANAMRVLAGQLRSNIANIVLDRKLRSRLLAIAIGEAPPLPTTESAEPASDAQDQPAAETVVPTSGA